MNYFLLANNKEFSESTVNKLKLDPNNDILVLFNFLIPLKFDKVKDYPNKICISRERPIKYRLDSTTIDGIKEYYCNMGTMRKFQDLFTEIYFLPCPANISSQTLSKEYIDHISLFNFDFDKIKCIDINYDIRETTKRLNYRLGDKPVEASTGVIIYNYLKNTKQKNDSIILVSFNSNLDKIYHDPEWETTYFLNEINNKNCYTIDSYNSTNFIF